MMVTMERLLAHDALHILLTRQMDAGVTGEIR